MSEPASDGAKGTSSRFERWAAVLLPERSLDPDARAEFDREAREVNTARVRAWGPPLVVLQALYVVFLQGLRADTVAEQQWRAGLVWITSGLAALHAVVVLAVYADRGALRPLARHSGAAFQLVGLLAYALVGVNAQRTHGSVGPFIAVAVVTPFVSRAPTAWYLAVLTAGTAVLVVGIQGVQPSPLLRANYGGTVLGFAFFAMVIARMYASVLVKDLQNRRALRSLNEDLESRVEAQTRELRTFATRLDDVLEGERRRLARELHDDLGQELTAMRFEVEALQASADEERRRAGLARMAGALDRSHTSVRAILESLRPRILDEEGLEAAIHWLVRQFRGRAGSKCECTSEVVLYDEPDPRVGLAAFRIVQESLTNVARHAGASSVRVSLVSDDDAMVLEVADDGGKREATAIAPGRGMTGMRERAAGVGGSLEVTAREPRGTLVRAVLPLQPPAAASAS